MKLRTTLAMVPLPSLTNARMGVARAFTSWRDACEKRGHSIESSPLRLIVGACFRCDDSEIILLAKPSAATNIYASTTRCRIDTDKGTYSFDPGELSAIRQCCAIIIPGSSSEVLGTLIEKTSQLSCAIGFVRKLTANRSPGLSMRRWHRSTPAFNRLRRWYSFMTNPDRVCATFCAQSGITPQWINWANLPNKMQSVV